jgi:hypothetical protein
MNAYQQRVNAERLASQAPAVRKKARELLDELRNLEMYLYWSFDPDEKDGGMYYCQSMLDHAHMLVDLAHEYRAELRANPPPKEPDEEQENEDAA